MLRCLRTRRQRQKAEKLGERAIALERKLTSREDLLGKECQDLSDAVAAVRRLATAFLTLSAGVDPNELEIALSNSITDEAGLSNSGRKDKPRQRRSSSMLSSGGRQLLFGTAGENVWRRQA